MERSRLVGVQEVPGSNPGGPTKFLKDLQTSRPQPPHSGVQLESNTLLRRGHCAGGSAIEASKIAGHSDLEMTGEYTFVAPERQNELTRRISEKLAEAASKRNRKAETPPQPAPSTPEVQPLGNHAIDNDPPAAVPPSFRQINPSLVRNTVD